MRVFVSFDIELGGQRKYRLGVCVPVFGFIVQCPPKIRRHSYKRPMEHASDGVAQRMCVGIWDRHAGRAVSTYGNGAGLAVCRSLPVASNDKSPEPGIATKDRHDHYAPLVRKLRAKVPACDVRESERRKATLGLEPARGIQCVLNHRARVEGLEERELVAVFARAVPFAVFAKQREASMHSVLELDVLLGWCERVGSKKPGTIELSHVEPKAVHCAHTLIPNDFSRFLRVCGDAQLRMRPHLDDETRPAKY